MIGQTSRCPSRNRGSLAPGDVSRQADDLASRLATRVPLLMDAVVVPGVQLAVIRDGTLAWHGAYGLANAQTGARVTDASVFEAASLTKPLFACAVLKLVDEGRLDLDTPLVAYLPGRYDLESDDPLKHVTARHVLTAASLHTTAVDYARFVAAAISGVGLRPETARQMPSPQARLDEAAFNTATVAPADSTAWAKPSSRRATRLVRSGPTSGRWSSIPATRRASRP